MTTKHTKAKLSDSRYDDEEIKIVLSQSDGKYPQILYEEPKKAILTPKRKSHGYETTPDYLDLIDGPITISWLPLELLHQMFDWIEDIRSLLKVRLVCTKWRVVIEENTLCQERIEVAKRALHVGWLGTITREEAELRIKDEPKGAFLFRYSSRVKSYVCTIKGDSEVEHIADIRPDSQLGGIIVFKKNGTTSHLQNLYKYIDFMRVKGIVSKPVPLNDEELSLNVIKGNKQVPTSLLKDLGIHQGDGSAETVRKQASTFFAEGSRKHKKSIDDSDITLPSQQKTQKTQNVIQAQQRNKQPSRITKKANELLGGFLARYGGFSKSAEDIDTRLERAHEERKKKKEKKGKLQRSNPKDNEKKLKKDQDEDENQGGKKLSSSAVL